MMIQIPKHPSSNIARVEALFQFLNLYNAAIYEVKFKFGGEVDDMGGGGAPEPVATFSPFNIQGNFDHSQLYVFTREGWDKPGVKSFGGYIFLMKTRALDPLIPSTVQFQQYGTLVSAYGILYFLESRKPFIQGLTLYFGKYNPDKKDWVQMPLKNWKRVKGDTCTPFQGREVVVGETIYALHMFQAEAIIAYALFSPATLSVFLPSS
ncbi:unnamed protein product [Prunus armeniaca]